MEFEKLFKGFTVAVIASMLITTLFSCAFIVSKKVKSNLPNTEIIENNQNR